MIYFVVLTILFSILGVLYLNVNILSLVLIVGIIPFTIYFYGKQSKNLGTIFLNQLFSYILAIFMSLKWNEPDKVNIYIYLLSCASYLRVMYMLLKAKIFRFFFWIPISYVVGDIFYLRFKNIYLFLLGFSLVVLIGLRDLKIREE